MVNKDNITIKEYFEKILSEKDKAINIALSSAKEAVEVAETNSEKWRQNANEWRGAMTDREKNFLTRHEFNEYKENTEKLMAIEKSRADKGEGKNTGILLMISLIITGIAIIGFILKLGK